MVNGKKMSELMDNSQAENDKSNEKKQNDILARREARRRRILDNAKSRLDKLSGNDRGATPTHTHEINHSTERYSDPEIDHPEYTSNYNPTYATPATPNHWDSSPLLNTPNAIPPTKFEKFLSSRVHIVATSAFTYTLLVLGINAIFSQSLFAVFLALECLELIFFRRERPLNPTVSMVLMLCGINLGKAGLYIKLFGLANKMVCDLSLFVFCFVISHCIYCGFVGDTFNESFYSF